MSRKQKNAKQYRGPDKFAKAAREQGFEARSVFKLEEINKRTRLLRQGDRVVDLGCFPGSWSRYVQQKIGRRGVLVGVDLQTPIGLRGTFVERSVLEVSAEELREALGGAADVVLSDMAPLTTGDRFGDHVRQVALAQVGLERAVEVLRPGGHFCVKLFDGEDVPAFTKGMRTHFKKVRRLKPEAVRGTSVEFYLVGLDFTP